MPLPTAFRTALSFDWCLNLARQTRDCDCASSPAARRWVNRCLGTAVAHRPSLAIGRAVGLAMPLPRRPAPRSLLGELSAWQRRFHRPRGGPGAWRPPHRLTQPPPTSPGSGPLAPGERRAVSAGSPLPEKPLVPALVLAPAKRVVPVQAAAFT